MRKLIGSLTVLVLFAGCRTPIYLGGEFTHRDPGKEVTAPVETFAHHERWVYFWGLLGSEEIQVPDVGGAFDVKDEIAKQFGPNEHLVDMVVEEGTTLVGVVTGFFTIGIVSQREVIVKARRVAAAAPP